MAEEYGLTSEGFKQKRLADIIQSMNNRIADQLGVQISTEANSVFGQLIGVFSYEIADLWEQTAQVYGAMYPHTQDRLSIFSEHTLSRAGSVYKNFVKVTSELRTKLFR